MKGSVAQTLVFSDWYRHRSHILLSLVGGGLSLALLQVGGAIPTVVGATWFFVALIVLGSMLPASNVINERKKQTLPFLMSLPISASQYAAAKLVSTVGMFLLPWLTLVAAAVSLIVSRPDIPDGMIPLVLVLATLTFLGFCIIAGIAMVSESEGWTIAATVASNSSYGLVWYLLIRNPAIRTDAGSSEVVWSSTVLSVLAGEIAAIALILGLIVYLQSRKRDFV